MYSNRGSAYIFVLVIVAAVSGMLVVSLSISGMQADLGQSYKNYSNLYELAVVGAEKSVNLLNDELDKKRSVITTQAIRDLATYQLESFTYYESFGGFDGEFHLKRANIGNKIGEKDVIFGERFVIDADHYISGVGILVQPVSFDFTVQVTEDMVVDYKVSVTLSVDRTKTPNHYLVTSTAERLDTKAKKTVTGKIICSGVHEEIYEPIFAWKTMPEWASYGIIARGSIAMPSLDSLDLRFAESVSPTDWDMTLLEESLFQPENPILVSDTLSQINVSDFYKDDDPIPVAIVLRQETQPVILYADEGKNKWKGILYAESEVIVQNVDIEGVVVSNADIQIENPDPDSISPNPNVLFDLRFSNKNKTNQKRLFDALGVTNFSQPTGTMDTATKLNHLWNQIKPDGIRSLSIRNADNIKYRLVSLKEQH